MRDSYLYENINTLQIQLELAYARIKNLQQGIRDLEIRADHTACERARMSLQDEINRLQYDNARLYDMLHQGCAPDAE